MGSEIDLESLTVPEVVSLEDAIGAIECYKYDSVKVADEIAEGIDAYLLQLEAKLPKMIENISCLGEDIINISKREYERNVELTRLGRIYRIGAERNTRTETPIRKKFIFGGSKKQIVDFSSLRVGHGSEDCIYFDFEDNSRSMDRIALDIRRSYGYSRRENIEETNPESFVKKYISLMEKLLRSNVGFNGMYKDIPYLLNQVPSLIGSIYGENLRLRKQKLNSVDVLFKEIKSLEVSDF